MKILSFLEIVYSLYVSFCYFFLTIDSSPNIFSQVEFYAIKLFNTNSIKRLEHWPSTVLRIRAWNYYNYNFERGNWNGIGM